MPEYKINITADFEAEASKAIKQTVDRGREIKRETEDPNAPWSSQAKSDIAETLKAGGRLKDVYQSIKKGEHSLDELLKSAEQIQQIQKRYSMMLLHMPTPDLRASVQLQMKTFDHMRRMIERKVDEGVSMSLGPGTDEGGGSSLADAPGIGTGLMSSMRQLQAGVAMLSKRMSPGATRQGMRHAVSLMGKVAGVVGPAAVAAMAPSGNTGRLGQSGATGDAVTFAAGLAGGSLGGSLGGPLGSAVAAGVAKASQTAWNKMIEGIYQIAEHSRNMAQRLEAYTANLSGYSPQATSFEARLDIAREQAQFRRARALDRAVGLGADAAIEGEMRGRAFFDQVDRLQILLNGLFDKLFNAFLGPILDLITKLLEKVADLVEHFLGEAGKNQEEFMNNAVDIMKLFAPEGAKQIIQAGHELGKAARKWLQNEAAKGDLFDPLTDEFLGPFAGLNNRLGEKAPQFAFGN